jgi:hypothetical protein
MGLAAIFCSDLLRQGSSFMKQEKIPRKSNGVGRLEIGNRVKVHSRHWLRAMDEGIIVDFRPDRESHWLVQFNKIFPGGGIDGDKLWLREDNLEKLKR